MYKIESNICSYVDNKFKVEATVLKGTSIEGSHFYWHRVGYFYEVVSPPTWIEKKLFNSTFEAKCKKQHDKLLVQANDFMKTQIALDKTVEEMRKVIILHE
jgi:hypothetical protein